MLMIVTTAALVSFGIRAHLERSRIHGTWRGANGDERYTMTFAGERLTMRLGTNPILATRESRFRVERQSGFIDIHRDDGLQLGLYAVDGDTLTLKLARVNLPRPKDLASNGRSRNARRYIFERQH